MKKPALEGLMQQPVLQPAVQPIAQPVPQPIQLPIQQPVQQLVPPTAQCCPMTPIIPVMPLFPKLAHAYVPFQYINCIYPPMMGLEQGTIFPELNRPYGVDPEYTVDA